MARLLRDCAELIATLAVLAAMACVHAAVSRRPPPQLARAEILAWEPDIDAKNGEPSYRVAIEFRDPDSGALVHERFEVDPRTYLRMRREFETCFDARRWPRELEPCR